MDRKSYSEIVNDSALCLVRTVIEELLPACQLPLDNVDLRGSYFVDYVGTIDGSFRTLRSSDPHPPIEGLQVIHDFQVLYIDTQDRSGTP